MKNLLEKMGLIRLCGGGRCPRVFKSENGDLIVQGILVDEKTRNACNPLPNEEVIRIPKDLLEELRKNL